MFEIGSIEGEGGPSKVRGFSTSPNKGEVDVIVDHNERA
jgi:hypothetical protein